MKELFYSWDYFNVSLFSEILVVFKGRKREVEEEYEGEEEEETALIYIHRMSLLFSVRASSAFLLNGKLLSHIVGKGFGWMVC